ARTPPARSSPTSAAARSAPRGRRARPSGAGYPARSRPARLARVRRGLRGRDPMRMRLDVAIDRGVRLAREADHAALTPADARRRAFRDGAVAALAAQRVQEERGEERR